MSRKALIVAGLSAIAIAASGCTGDSEAEAESPPATTTEQAIQLGPAAVDISAVRAAFKKRFGTPGNEAPWYRLVTGLKMTAPGRINVETKLDPASNWESEGVPCGAIWRLAFELMEENGDLAVAVIASDGTELGGCA